MPPATRSQTAAGEVNAANEAPPRLDLPPSDEIRFDETDGEGAWSSGMKMRQEASTQFGPQSEQEKKISDTQSTSSKRSRRNRPNEPDEPPRFVIDLSLPPEQRYLAVCNAFQAEIADLVPLFDEVLGGILHFVPIKWLHRLCRLFLRRVYDGEENAELKGISKATGVSMYLLVCFNVLLDLFMGCSSGGAAVRAEGAENGSKMVHFRTLDWGMPSLRRVVVQLDFVLDRNGPVFASSITYAGYVGVLTGVRKGLSMSLNFRPNRIDNGVFWSDAKYIWHLLCVLLGWRRSISSTLRGYLLPKRRRRGWLPLGKATQGKKDDLLDYAGVVKDMGGNGASGKRPITTTACYFCVCDGNETTVIEKDRVSAKARSGDEFIVVTNTDESPPSTPETHSNDRPATTAAGAIPTAATNPAESSELAEIISEAQDRQECAFHNWRNLQSSRARELGMQHVSGEGRKRLASVEDVVQLVQKYPTTNECTHFAAVMDPSQTGRDGAERVLWCRRWKDPIDARWIRAHMSGTW